jgi:8-oxo-dGTP diphosphatase
MSGDAATPPAHVREGSRGALLVVAAVIEDQGRFFVCRRGPGRAAAGKWEFPGGKVEESETPESALVREIREELGVHVTVHDHLITEESVGTGGRTIRLVCLRASLAGPRPMQSTDHDRLEWLRPSEFELLDWAEPDLPAVRLLTR